jgi:hypothetical protein
MSDVLRSVLAEVEYFPGWRLVPSEDDYEGPTLWVLADVPNAYRPGETQRLEIETFVPPLADRDAALAWLEYRLRRIAVHEHREWFRVNGRPYSDPHAERLAPR